MKYRYWYEFKKKYRYIKNQSASIPTRRQKAIFSPQIIKINIRKPLLLCYIIPVYVLSRRPTQGKTPLVGLAGWSEHRHRIPLLCSPKSTKTDVYNGKVCTQITIDTKRSQTNLLILS